MKEASNLMLQGSGFSPEREDDRHYLSCASTVRAKNVLLYVLPALEEKRLKPAKSFLKKTNVSIAKCVF
jgi:hypothetical protein